MNIKKMMIATIIITIIILAGCTTTKDYQTVPENNTDYCKTIKEEIKSMIEQENYCEKDEDCMTEDKYNCPFNGCYLLVNKKTDMTRIDQKVEEYKKECPRCTIQPKCMQPPKENEMKCENKKCIDVRFKK